MGAIYNWTMTVGVAATALRSRSLLISSVVVQADPDNAGSVFVGDADGQAVELVAGTSETIPIDCPTKVYVRGSVAGQVVNVHAVNEGRRNG